MLSVSRSLLATLCLCLTAATVQARVGEPIAQIKARFGKPDPQSPKNMVIWFIETDKGPLVYTVNYNAKGLSIGEGLKPLKNSSLPNSSAKDFLQDQMIRVKDSPTTRVVKPGEKYDFAGHPFVCEADDFVVLDETLDLLIIWSRGGTGQVMAISREMLDHPPR